MTSRTDRRQFDVTVWRHASRLPIRLESVGRVESDRTPVITLTTQFVSTRLVRAYPTSSERFVSVCRIELNYRNATSVSLTKLNAANYARYPDFFLSNVHDFLRITTAHNCILAQTAVTDTIAVSPSPRSSCLIVHGFLQQLRIFRCRHSFIRM